MTAHHARRIAPVLTALALLTPGCGDDGSGVDAGPRLDSGRLDAGGGTDGGPPIDASGAPDAGGEGTDGGTADAGGDGTCSFAPGLIGACVLPGGSCNSRYAPTELPFLERTCMTGEGEVLEGEPCPDAIDGAELLGCCVTVGAVNVTSCHYAGSAATEEELRGACERNGNCWSQTTN